MIANVRGQFQDFDLKVTTQGEGFAQAQVELTIQAASLYTGTEARDNHLRSADFFHVAQFPTITFRSTSLTPTSSTTFVLEGELTIRNTTRPVTFQLEYGGKITDAYGVDRAGFSLSARIDREAYGLSWNYALNNNNAVVGKQVQIQAEIQLKRVDEPVQQDTFVQSLQAATRTQQSQLPDLDYVRRYLPELDLMYAPKDQVGGDFYWFEEKEGYLMLLLGDSTGHGLEGSLKSMMAMSLLNQLAATADPRQPEELLRRLHDAILQNARKSGRPSSMMALDGALLVFHPDRTQLTYVGAGVPLYLLRQGQLHEYKPAKLSVGSHLSNMDALQGLTLQLQPSDRLFALSDGYKDQFGGPYGKKLGPKNTRSYLEEMAASPFATVRSQLEQRFHDWRGQMEQMDDVSLITVQI